MERQHLQHAGELGVAIRDVGLILGEGVDHISECQQTHVDVDALLKPRPLRLCPLLALTACMPSARLPLHRMLSDYTKDLRG